MTAALLVLVVATPGLPLLLALTWPVPRLRRVGLAVAPWAAAPALALALASVLLGGGTAAAARNPDVFLGLSLALDPLGRAFLLLAGLLWLAAGAFARAYHAEDETRSSFFGFFLLTMAGNLGLSVASEALSFYLFFALMTFSAYGLIIHDRHEEAFRAGRVYIVLAVLADLALLAGLMSLGAASGFPLRFGADLDAAWAQLARNPGFPGPALVASLLLVGFGVKAGLVPLHVWLPLAHPVAPTAASALLSGAMIKAGVLGWLRTLPGELALPAVGAALLCAGVVTAFYAVFMGIAQDDPKTVLAYSSASQIGFMAVAVGVLLREPDAAALAVAAASVYAVHHGLAKGALFLSVGLADRSAPRRHPRWRALLLAGAVLPSLAVAGAPLTTGARAKALLEKAVEELGTGWYHALEPLLLAAAFGTTLIMARFLVTLGSRGREAGGGEESLPAAGLWIPWGALVTAGVLGALWLPVIAPFGPEPEMPPLLEGLARSLLPVAAGAGVAWAAFGLAGRLPRLRDMRIPAGDLLVPVEALLRHAPRISQPRLVARARALLRWTASARRAVLGAGDRLADFDPLLTRGAVLAAIVLLLAAALSLLLTS